MFRHGRANTENYCHPHAAAARVADGALMIVARGEKTDEGGLAA
jgi:hypothetical protein